jgi:hypothetical protein
MKFELPNCKHFYSQQEALKELENHKATYYQEGYSFKVNNIGVLQIDKDNRTFYDFVIPRNCDIISNFKSNISYKIIVNERELDVVDYIILVASPYTEFKCRFYIRPEWTDLHFRLNYNCILLSNDDRVKLVMNDVTTDYFDYSKGTCKVK